MEMASREPIFWRGGPLLASGPCDQDTTVPVCIQKQLVAMVLFKNDLILILLEQL